MDISMFLNLFHLFFKPKRLIADIDKETLHWFPFVFIALSSFLYSITMIILDDRIDGKATIIGVVFALISIPMITMISMGIFSCVVWFLCSKILKGNVLLDKIFTLVSWSTIIEVSINQIILSCIYLYHFKLENYSTVFHYIISKFNFLNHSYLNQVLSRIDILEIWSVIIMGIGIKYLCKFSIVRTVLVCIILFSFNFIGDMMRLLNKIF